MKVLVACEESQAVTIELRKLGHEAYSNDVIECSGGHHEWHLQMDCFEAIRLNKWDMIIMHPPCTALAVSGNRWYGEGMPKNNERISAAEWTMSLWDLAISVCSKVAMENPVGVLNKLNPSLPKPHYIQPWQFGHGETKKTGLWLHGLAPLIPADVVDGREQKIWKMPPSKDRARLRSKTYEGIARAMAEQWAGKA